MTGFVLQGHILEWFLKDHVTLETEDWSNDAENSALHHRNKLHYYILTYKTVI